MNKYKICVYAISKNEEQFVDRWMDAVSEADAVIVTDTGSTDHTVERLRERGAIVYEETISPWRFDTARNVALSHVPEDADICVSNDLDEVFEPGWRQKLEDLWKPEYTRARYLFTFACNPDGTPQKQYPMEKIHIRHGYRWYIRFMRSWNTAVLVRNKLHGFRESFSIIIRIYQSQEASIFPFWNYQLRRIRLMTGLCSGLEENIYIIKIMTRELKH